MIKPRLHKWNWSALIAQLLCVGILFMALGYVQSEQRRAAHIKSIIYPHQWEDNVWEKGE